MSSEQSPAAHADRGAIKRVISVVDTLALSLLYVMVVAGLPMVAIGLLTQSV
ncbi:MAG: hypothetical protein ACYC8V_07485 [Caulobacteraceae bacterium]